MKTAPDDGRRFPATMERDEAGADARRAVTPQLAHGQALSPGDSSQAQAG